MWHTPCYACGEENTLGQMLDAIDEIPGRS